MHTLCITCSVSTGIPIFNNFWHHFCKCCMYFLYACGVSVCQNSSIPFISSSRFFDFICSSQVLLQKTPAVFNWVEIRGPKGCFPPIDTMKFQNTTYKLTKMFRIIVLLEPMSTRKASFHKCD